MEKRGVPRFFSPHNSCVRSVAFSPKDRYIFCSGGNDGNLCIYHAGRAEMLKTYAVISVGINRHINAVRFTSDGRKILAVATSRRLSVLDAENGTSILCYDNCAFSGRDRSALATDPTRPHIAVCSYVNGKGITMFDLRMPLPLDFAFDFHPDVIRDIHFLNDSWPFNKSGSLLSISAQGLARVTTLDGRILHSFDFNHASNTIVATPEKYGSAEPDGFTSALVSGGTVISSYAPSDDTTMFQATLSHGSGQSSISDGGSSQFSVIMDELRGNSTSNYSNPLGLPYRYYISSNSSGGGSSSANRSDSNSGLGPAVPISSSGGSTWNPAINVIISNTGVNGNASGAGSGYSVYHVPRRNELQFGNMESIRITRALRQIVATSQQQLYSLPSSSANSSSSYISALVTNRGANSSSAAGSSSSSSGSSLDLGLNSASSPDEPCTLPMDLSVAPLNTYIDSNLFYHDRWDHSNSEQPQQIWRLRYTSNGAMLYAAGEGGAVRYYRRYPNLELKCLGEVYHHRNDVLDMDISSHDDYLVTASRDKSVGLICLGAPSHGYTEYYELT